MTMRQIREGVPCKVLIQVKVAGGGGGGDEERYRQPQHD
jgi:hypothetical protein